MKNLFFTLALLSSTELVLAQVPRITNKKFANYQKFTNNEKAEVGTFFLLQSLAAKGMIGGDSGVCVNYKRGDGAGTADQITFAVKTQPPQSGEVAINGISQAEIDKLKPVLNQMQKFFATNCQGQGPNCVQIDVTGFSDGTRQKDQNNPTKSNQFNTDLAKKRAGVYESEIKSTGIDKFGKISTSGSPSLFGQYLDIIKKAHNGNFNSFLGSLKKDGAEYNFAKLHKDKFENILSGKENYKIDCPARRVTTLDFKFNSSSIQFAESSSTTVSPSLYAGGADFNFNALMDAALQVGEATNGESFVGKSDAEVDGVVAKLMQKAGINDPEMLSQCKSNGGAREMVRYLSKQFNRLGSKRNKLLADVRKDRTSVITGMREDDADPSIKSMFDNLAKETDLDKNKNTDFPGVTGDGGLSNTKLNCFGVQATLKAYAQANSDKIKKACIPLQAESDTKVKFNPKSTHIGCTQCKTGLKVEEVIYRDPISGKQMKSMEPIYVPREQNTSYGDHAGFIKYTYFQPVGKLDAEIVSLNKIKQLSKIPDIGGPNQDFLTKFNTEIAAIANDGSFAHLKYLAVGNFAKYASLLKKYYDLDPADLPAITNYVTRASRDRALGPEESAAQAYVRAGIDKTDMAIAKKAYIKATQPYHDDPMETARLSQDPGVQMTLAGLKSPSYYELDNCDCSDPALFDKVMANGKRHNITEESKMKPKAGSCIVSLPIPTSCMVSPNNPGGDVHSDTHTDSKISWIDSEGETVNVLLDNLAAEVSNINQNFDFQGCSEKSPFSLAQQVVNSVKCDPAQGFVIPTDEFKDCGGDAK